MNEFADIKSKYLYILEIQDLETGEAILKMETEDLDEMTSKAAKVINRKENDN